MAGGILQIVAYGAQDMYLTNDPQVTFFKVVYRRYTNFSIETFERTVNDSPNFGHKSAVKIYRLGDLMTKMYLRIVISKFQPNEGALCAWVRRLGHAILRRAEINIGGSIIDRQYGTWLDIWYELARTGKHEKGYNVMIADVDSMTGYNDKQKPEYVLYIPMKFWFNRNIGLALPLIAIQYHDIYFNFELEEKTKLIIHNGKFTNYEEIKILDVGLLIDYIYLDMTERTKFASVGHEYLIEQVQFTDDNVEISTKRIKLDFNFPTKELIWAMKNGKYTTGQQFLFYTNKNDWTDDLNDFSMKVILDSSVITNIPPLDPGQWEEFLPNSSGLSSFGNLNVVNGSLTESLWINIESLMYKSYNLINTIYATVTVDISNNITVTNITESLSIRDISIPVAELTDTRLVKDYVNIFQYNNYGLFIDGSGNPLDAALIEYNADERCVKRNGTFFGYLQPQMHHINQPADGINLYSFAIFPEKHQPSGASNLSRIENIIFTAWFADTSNKKNKLPNMNIFNLDNRLYIFAFSYNVLRIISGLAALAYNG